MKFCVKKKKDYRSCPINLIVEKKKIINMQSKNLSKSYRKFYAVERMKLQIECEINNI